MGMLRHDLTIEDVMTDPLIGALMRADHVDPLALRSLLDQEADALGARTRGTERGLQGRTALSMCCAIVSRTSANEARTR